MEARGSRVAGFTDYRLQADWPTALNSPLALGFAHALRLHRLMSVTPNSGIWPSKNAQRFICTQHTTPA
jgi:hypothetical protein